MSTKTRPKPHPSTSAIYAFAEELRRQMVAEYRPILEGEYAAAVTATNGAMVSREGQARGHSSWDVFQSPLLTSVHGTRELQEYLAAHPRTTRTAYEAAWVEAWRTGGEQAA